MSTTSARVTTYREVLAEPSFRVIFLTRSVAIAAYTLRTVALSILVFEVTGSPALAAITYGAAFVPQAVGATFLGALADRFAPRRLIALGYVLEAAAGLLVGLADLPVAVNLIVVAAVALYTPVFAGASSRLVATVLTGDAFVVGRSLFSMAQSGAQLAGLAFGAAAVATIEPRRAVVLAAVLHVLSGLAVRRFLPNHPVAPRPGPSAVRHSWTGTRELLTDRPVLILMLAQWLPPAFVTGAESLLVPYSHARNLPDSMPGLLLASVPVGMILGEVVVGRLLPPGARERLVVPLVVILGLPLLAFVATPGPVLAGALLLISGTGFAYCLGIQRKFLDAVGEYRRGQAFGLLAAGLMTCQGLGPAVFGALAEVIPAGTSIAAAGAVTVLTAGALVASLSPSRREGIADERG